MTRFRYQAAWLVLVLAWTGVTQAQETTGTIQGRAVDAQALPIPGMLVTVAGPQGLKAVVTGADGRFAVAFLTPGVYEVRAELRGFKTIDEKAINVSPGQVVDVLLKMDVGAVTDTVSVASADGVNDPASATADTVISQDLLERSPVGRRLSDALYMAPGVADGGSVGRTNPSMAGGTGLDHQYMVDGLNITNIGYGALGSYSGTFGSLGYALPVDFVHEVKVKTGGYEAEFGQSSAGLVNVIMKSGSNSTQGSLFGFSRPKQLEGAWKEYQSANGSVQTLSSSSNDVGVEGGLPMIKNRLFVFGAIDPQYETRTLQAPGNTNASGVRLFPLYNTSGYDQNRHNLPYTLKSTVQLTSAHRIDASVFGDPSNAPMGLQRTSALLGTTASFSELTYGGHNQMVQYDGVFSSRWLVQASFGRALNRVSEIPATDVWRVRDRTVTPNTITGGLGLYDAGNRGVNNQYSVKFANVAGSHHIRYGYEYDDATYSQAISQTGPTFAVAAPGQAAVRTATGATIDVLPDPTLGRIYVAVANLNTGRETNQKYQSLFAQDSWKMTRNLSVNLGIRYEQEEISGAVVKGWTLKNNWAPRAGVAIDPTDDGKTKIFASGGRYFARVPNDLAARGLSSDTVVSADFFDSNLTRQIPNGVLAGPVGFQTPIHYAIAGGAAESVDPNTRLPYADELVGGVERELLPNTSIVVRYTYRTIGRIVEDVGTFPLVASYLGVPGSDSFARLLTNPSASTALDPRAAAYGALFADPAQRYDAVDVVLQKRYANNWSGLASYRWSRLRGNVEGFYRNDNGQSNPGNSTSYDFPTDDVSYAAIGTPLFGFKGDLRYLSDPNGILPLDQPHQAKLFGNYAWGNGLGLGVGLYMSSGKPLTPLAANPIYRTGGEIPLAARGSGIQTVDGFLLRTPAERRVDLQATYTAKLGGRRQLTLVADVFNVLNDRRPTGYDSWSDLAFGVTNPDFGKPVSQVFAGAPPQFQTPIQVRLGARFAF